MSNKITFTVLIKSVPGKSDELKTAIVELIGHTIKEPGCELFKVFQHNEDPEQFTLWEIFISQQAMQEHMAKDYTQDYFSLGLALETKGIQHSDIYAS